MSIIQLLLSNFFAGAAAQGDPYWQYTTLLSGTGTTNGAQNNTFIDSSSNNFTITRNGNTTQGTFTPFSGPDGYWGNFFDGTGDYLSLSNSADFQFNGQFCVEMWVNFSALNTNNFLVSQFNASGESGWLIRHTGTALRIYAENGAVNLDNSWTPTIGTWSHIAVTRDGSNVIRMFVNGSQIGSNSTNSTTMSATTAAYIGGHPSLSTDTNAYISNLRIVKGSAVYTSNFTPSTTPLAPITNTKLLTCQSNRFIDTNTEVAAKTITANGNPAVVPFAPFGNTSMYSTTSVGGSGYFDGSGDQLDITNNAAFEVGNGNFTYEAWVYALRRTNTYGQGIISYGIASSTGSSTNDLQINSSGYLQLAYATGTSGTLTDTSLFPLNEWVHCVVCRTSSTISMFVNGTRKATTSTSATVGTGGAMTIGGQWYANEAARQLQGYIASARVIKGTGPYDATSSTITVPTAPLTNITNTSLLCNFTNAGIYDQAAKNDMETVGNAQVSTSVVKYGSGSIAFDGTGDFMVMPYSQMFNFGTGDFTLECWAKITYVQYTAIISSTNTTITTGQWLLGYSNTANQMSFAIDSGGAAIVGADFSNYLNTWTHIAVARTGGVLKLFFNGNQVASVANTTNFTGDTANPVVMGRRYTNSTNYPLNGNISDLRITKGLARYTYNFTPPTQALANFYSAPVTPTADPYFDYTTLLLPGSGTNGAQNNTFLDSSTNAFSITRNGNTTQGTFSPFSQTGWSNYFTAASSGLYNASGSNTAIHPAASFLSAASGSRVGSIEALVYVTAYPSSPASGEFAAILNFGGNYFNFGVNSSGELSLYYYSGSSAYTESSPANAIPLNQWVYVAAIFDSSNNVKLYVNGNLVKTATFNGVGYASGNNTMNQLRVGRTYGAGTSVLQGYISNLRIVDGTAVTPTTPTTPLTAITNTKLLTCQSNRFVDNSASPYTLTIEGTPSVQAFSPFAPTAAYSAATNGGSGYFDGTGDYLTVANDVAIDAGTGPFTYECWFYATSQKQEMLLGANGTGAGFHLGLYNDYITLGRNNIAEDLGTAAGTIRLNEWNHIVAVRNSSNNTAIFINGTRQAYAASNTNNYGLGGYSLGIGIAENNSSYTAIGYMSGARVSKSALYDPTQTTLTVPTAPATTGALLLNFTNAGITDATAKNDLETVGDSQISNTTAKFGSTSIKFDGTGDWLLTRTSPNLDMGTGDLTIEGWFYLTTSPADYQMIVSDATNGNNYVSIRGGGTGGQIEVNVSGTSFRFNLNNSVSASTWFHLAVSRYNGTWYGFINGASLGSASGSGAFNLGNGGMYVGRFGGATAYAWPGYMQDLRITKGVARYTQNFTPPTAAFQLL